MRTSLVVFWLPLLVMLAGCGRLEFEADVDAPGDDAACMLGPWSTPMPIAALATTENDWDVALAPDNQTLVFSRVASSYELWTATWNGTTATPPARLAALDGTGSELNPSWSPDGTTLYFSGIATGGLRLHTSAFDGTSFAPPVVVPELAGIEVVGAFVSADDLELVYSSTTGGERMWRATRARPSDPWVVDRELTELGIARAAFPTLSGDRLVLYFDAWPSGRRELFRATRAAVDQPFGTPELELELGDPVASTGDAELARDGRTMMIASDRVGTTGRYDLWYATRACL